MAKPKQALNFYFHNPNTPEESADFILKVFIAAQRETIEQALRNAVSICPDLKTNDQ